MHLIFGTGEEFSNPTAEQISVGLAELTGFGDSFAILSKSEMTYVQASRDHSTGFLVEYQVESLDSHYRSERDDLSLESVQSLFLAYAADDDSWNSRIEWVRDDFSVPESSWKLVTVGLVAAAVVIGLLAWRNGV